MLNLAASAFHLLVLRWALNSLTLLGFAVKGVAFRNAPKARRMCVAFLLAFGRAESGTDFWNVGTYRMELAMSFITY